MNSRTQYIVELRLGGPYWIEGKGWATSDDTKATRYTHHEAGEIAGLMHGFMVEL